jgi:hypothetical protein
MKPRTESIDKLIREALSAEEAEYFDQLGEQSIPEMVTETFLGHRRWLNLGGMLIGSVMLVVGLVCAINFYEAAEIREMLRWGAGAAFCLTGIVGMKIWYWMELQRNALTREVKRLELQVSHLASQLRR